MIRLLVLVLVLTLVTGCRSRKKETEARRPAPVAKKAPAKTAKKTMPSKAASDWQEALGISSREARASRLYSFIGEWYGAPYKYGGCVKSGVDCSCFASLLHEKVYNRNLPRSANDMFLASEKITLREAREGDLVFFKIGSKKVSHVGVYLGKSMFVHSSSSRGVIVNSINEAYYKKYFFCAGRLIK